MTSEFITSVVLIVFIVSLNLIDIKSKGIKKAIFISIKSFLLIAFSYVYIFGLTSDTPTYRAFLLFIGAYLIGNILVNLFILKSSISDTLSKYTNDYTKINNANDFKHKNLNARIVIYILAFIVSVANYLQNQWEDINNVFTTVIIIDVIIGLLLTKFIKDY
ncbi:hypothetical protein K4P64_04075 [Staphylococcus epidermidis]|nr:hypothetical protein [Staphylococcus epidermidis]MCG2079366.1 hypothetical protein [Staphylococcus epidermidis]